MSMWDGVNWASAPQDLRLRVTSTWFRNAAESDRDVRVSEVPTAYDDRVTFLVEHNDGTAMVWAGEPVDTKDAA